MAGFKFIYGCVTIHVMSGSRERFINMCHHRKICLEHVISSDEYLEAVISARNFRPACEIAKKTGNKIRIKKKKDMTKLFEIVFGLVIFLSEFMMDHSGTIQIAGLTIVQYAALLLIILGITKKVNHTS